MPQLVMKSDILAPAHTKTLKFFCDHPSKLMKVMPSLIKETFKITSTNFFEDRIKWDISADPVEFYGEWRGKDTKDNRTTLWVSVKLQGKQSLKEKKGEITIWLSGSLITQIPYSMIIDKTLYRIYAYYFYSNQRRYYSSIARDLFGKLEEVIKKELEIEGE